MVKVHSPSSSAALWWLNPLNDDNAGIENFQFIDCTKRQFGLTWHLLRARLRMNERRGNISSQTERGPQYYHLRYTSLHVLSATSECCQFHYSYQMISHSDSALLLFRLHRLYQPWTSSHFFIFSTWSPLISIRPGRSLTSILGPINTCTSWNNRFSSPSNPFKYVLTRLPEFL